jgi:glycosyltransferase involved in cell wall biosynthesis
MSLISIFIPVYNGEQYLHKTIQSIIDQTYNNYVVYFVDDNSTDSSLYILREYQSKDSRIKVFTKPNQGSVPYSWHFILPYITSAYTCYLSQDDLLSSDYLEQLLNKAQQTNADAVIPIVEYYYENRSDNPIAIGLNGNIDKELTGREAFIYSLNWQIPGFALWKTELIKRIGIKTDAFNSDELAQRLWFLNSQLVVFASGKFFYRQDNAKAITKHFGVHHFTSAITNLHLLNTMTKENIDSLLIDNFHRKYFDSLFYLNACHIQYKIGYSRHMNECIRTIINNSFLKLKNVPTINCNIIYKIKYAFISHFHFLFTFSSYIFMIRNILKSHFNKQAINCFSYYKLISHKFFG